MKCFALFTMELTNVEASFLVDVSSIGGFDFRALSEWRESVGMNDFQINLECEYGVHDFAGFDDLVLSDRVIIHLGYDSYEVTEDTLNDLMNKWSVEFARHLGADKVSPVYVRSEFGEGSLAALYESLFPHLDYLS